jgi:hypothetical protein
MKKGEEDFMEHLQEVFLLVFTILWEQKRVFLFKFESVYFFLISSGYRLTIKLSLGYVLNFPFGNLVDLICFLDPSSS